MAKKPEFHQFTHEVGDGFPLIEELWRDCETQADYRIEKAIEEGKQLPSDISRNRVVIQFMVAAMMAVTGVASAEESASILSDWLENTWRLGKLEVLLGAEKMKEALEVLYE